MSGERHLVVRIKNLDKCYFKRDVRSGSLSPFYALRNVSFDVVKGEILGIIGKNGSGKSTLLKILSGITRPTEGEVEIFGTPSSILDIGTGIHPEISGRENVYLRGQLLGMKRQQVDEVFEELVAFSGIGDFIDTPVKHYSSGMFLRLAFSIIVHLSSEILFLDEVLAVGDVDFKRKSSAKIREIVAKGCTVIMVSHEMSTVLDICTRAILLQSGQVEAIGSPEEVVKNSYLIRSENPKQQDFQEVVAEFGPMHLDEWGVEIESFLLIGANGNSSGTFPNDEEIQIQLKYTIRQDRINLAFAITDVMDGKLIDDSPVLEAMMDKRPQVGEYLVEWTIPSGLFHAGFYFVDLLVVDESFRGLKKLDRALRFKITDTDMPNAVQHVYRSAFKIDLNRRIQYEQL